MEKPIDAVAELCRFIRPKTIARRYGVSSSVVYGGIYSGELPALKFRDRVWLIRPEDADDWIRRNSESNVQAA